MPKRSKVLEVEVLDETDAGVRCRTKSGKELVVPASDLTDRPSRVSASGHGERMFAPGGKGWNEV